MTLASSHSTHARTLVLLLFEPACMRTSSTSLACEPPTHEHSCTRTPSCARRPTCTNAVHAHSVQRTARSAQRTDQRTNAFQCMHCPSFLPRARATQPLGLDKPDHLAAVHGLMGLHRRQRQLVGSPAIGNWQLATGNWQLALALAIGTLGLVFSTWTSRTWNLEHEPRT